MVNEAFAAEVMDMTRMRDEYPQSFALVAQSRITNRRLQKTAFQPVVARAFPATVALWAALVMMMLAFFGIVTPNTAKTLTIGTALMFTTT